MKSTLSAAATLTLFSYLTKVALADFPLYIPGFDPQPLSATVLGVGSDGHTTYQISPAKATDPSQDDSSNPTFTMVEGPTDVFFTMALPVETGSPDLIYESCSFGSNSNGEAVCIISATGADLNISGMSTETDEVTPITVQGDIAASPTGASTPTSGGSGPSGSTPTSGGGASQPTNKSSGTGSASNSAASPTNTGAASSLRSRGIMTFGAGLLVSLFLPIA